MENAAEQEQTVIKDCQHCGYEAEVLAMPEWVDSKTRLSYRVTCSNCLMSTPLSNSKAFVLQIWNARVELFNNAVQGKICPYCQKEVKSDEWEQLAHRGNRNQARLSEYWHRECRLDYLRHRPGWVIRCVKWLFAWTCEESAVVS